MIEFYKKYTENKYVELLKRVFFFLALTIELTTIVIDKSCLTNPFEGQIWRLTFVLGCLVMACTYYEWKEIAGFLVLAVIGFVSYKVTGRNEMLRLTVFLMSGKDILARLAMKYTFYFLTAGSAIIFILSAFGIGGAFLSYEDYGRNGYEYRYSFGMGHPNAFHCMFFSLMILAVAIWFAKMKWWHYVLLFALNILVYIFTDSRTGMFVASFSLVVAMMFHFCKKWRDQKWVYYLCALVVFGVFAFSIYAAYAKSESSLGYMFDRFSNRRIHGAVEQVAAGIENWKLFGDAAYQEYFDMGIIRLFYWFGYIPGVLYFLSMLFMLYKAYKAKEYGLAIMVVSFTVYTLTEAHFISDYLMRNFLWIYMLTALFEQKAKPLTFKPPIVSEE